MISKTNLFLTRARKTSDHKTDKILIEAAFERFLARFGRERGRGCRRGMDGEGERKGELGREGAIAEKKEGRKEGED